MLWPYLVSRVENNADWFYSATNYLDLEQLAYLIVGHKVVVNWDYRGNNIFGY